MTLRIARAASFAVWIGLVIPSIASPDSTSAPATRHADESTRDALSEIDALSADSPNLDAHGSLHPNDLEPAEASLPQSWWDLIEFFLPGLLTAASIGVAGSTLGTFVLLRREALLALAMPQVVAAGAAVGMRMGWPTLPPAVLAAVVALLYLVAARRGGHAGGAGRGSAIVVPALYVCGLSLSFLVIAGGGQHVEELQNLFTGIDVAVTPQQAALAIPVLLAAGLTCAVLWRRWLLLAQAPAAAELAGVNPARWDALFLTLLTTVLLVGTNSQGVVMVLAMLFLPAAIVLPWARRLPTALGAAGGVALLCLAGGFVLSNEMYWPLSQSVGGVGTAALVVSHGIRAIVGR